VGDFGIRELGERLFNGDVVFKAPGFQAIERYQLDQRS
jgi:hypothetical protein